MYSLFKLMKNQPSRKRTADRGHTCRAPADKGGLRKMALRAKYSTPAERILEAAADLFADKQYNEVSVKEIAQLAGVNNAMISYYFGGKSNLYKAVLERQAENLFASVKDIEKMPINPLAKLRTLMDRIINNRMNDNSDHNYIYTSILFSTPESMLAVTKQRSKIMFYLQRFSKAAQEEKLLAPGFSGDSLAYCLQSILGNYMLERCAFPHRENANPEALQQSVTACYCNLFNLVEAKPER